MGYHDLFDLKMQKCTNVNDFWTYLKLVANHQSPIEALHNSRERTLDLQYYVKCIETSDFQADIIRVKSNQICFKCVSEVVGTFVISLRDAGQREDSQS